MPARLSTYDIPAYKEQLADTSNIAAVTCKVAQTMSEQNYYFTSPAFSGSANARTQVGLLTWAVFTNYSMSASDATNNQMIDTMFNQQEAECEKNS